MKVTDQNGVEWRVGRRWLPWRRRLRAIDAPGADSAWHLGDDPVSAVLGIVLLVLAVPAIIVGFFVLLEMLLLVLLLPVFVLVRAWFGAGWRVQLLHAGRIVHHEAVRGWRASRQRIAEIAEHVRRGEVRLEH